MYILLYYIFNYLIHSRNIKVIYLNKNYIYNKLLTNGIKQNEIT